MTKKISQNILDDAISFVDNWLEYNMVMSTKPGICVGIVYKDKIIFNKAYGFAQLSNRKMLKKEHLFRIASISKIFTAISIMQLVEKDRLNLDDKVANYLDWFKSDVDKTFEKITIRQLMNHTAGLVRGGYQTSFWSLEEPFLDKKALIKQIKDTKNIYKNNEIYKYSNVGPSILGSVVESVSGISYEDYIKKNILNPLRLKNTHVDFDEKLTNKMATGHGRFIPRKERTEFPHFKANAMAPAVGFCTNVEDLCRFVSAQFPGSGKLLSEESKREMFRIQWVSDDDEIKWGLGYEFYKFDKTKAIGHSGGCPGFISMMGFDTKKELGVVVLSNDYEGGGATECVTTIFHILKNIFERYNEFSNKVKNPDRYIGRYFENGYCIDVRKVNSELVLYYSENEKPFEKIFRLKQLNKEEFEVVSGDEFSYIGEKVFFEFGKNNKVKKVIFGAVNYYPFEKSFSQLKNVN